MNTRLYSVSAEYEFCQCKSHNIGYIRIFHDMSQISPISVYQYVNHEIIIEVIVSFFTIEN